jgi:hypothetical protein
MTDNSMRKVASAARNVMQGSLAQSQLNKMDIFGVLDALSLMPQTAKRYRHFHGLNDPIKTSRCGMRLASCMRRNAATDAVPNRTDFRRLAARQDQSYIWGIPC